MNKTIEAFKQTELGGSNSQASSSSLTVASDSSANSQAQAKGKAREVAEGSPDFEIISNPDDKKQEEEEEDDKEVVIMTEEGKAERDFWEVKEGEEPKMPTKVIAGQMEFLNKVMDQTPNFRREIFRGLKDAAEMQSGVSFQDYGKGGAGGAPPQGGAAPQTAYTQYPTAYTGADGYQGPSGNVTGTPAGGYRGGPVYEEDFDLICDTPGVSELFSQKRVAPHPILIEMFKGNWYVPLSAFMTRALRKLSQDGSTLKHSKVLAANGGSMRILDFTEFGPEAAMNSEDWREAWGNLLLVLLRIFSNMVVERFHQHFEFISEHGIFRTNFLALLAFNIEVWARERRLISGS